MNILEIRGVSRTTVSIIVNERGTVIPEMALRLARAFTTTPDLWLNFTKKTMTFGKQNKLQIRGKLSNPFLQKDFKHIHEVMVIKKESGLKTIDFGLKPSNSLVFNNPDLKVGAIDVVVNKGFSPFTYFFSYLFRPDSRKKMIRIPSHREPTHPGEMLLEKLLIPLGITQNDLAFAISVPYQSINEIVNKKRGIGPRIALRLARFFGMTEDFWINLQLRRDLFIIKNEEYQAMESIKPAAHLHATVTL